MFVTTTHGATFASQGPGDLWYFPPGVPHSLQGTNQTADGTEFLLVFPDGSFSEDSTFLVCIMIGDCYNILLTLV